MLERSNAGNSHANVVHNERLNQTKMAISSPDSMGGYVNGRNSNDPPPLHGAVGVNLGGEAPGTGGQGDLGRGAWNRQTERVTVIRRYGETD